MRSVQESHRLHADGVWPVQRDARLMNLLRSCLQHLEGRDRVDLYNMLRLREREKLYPPRPAGSPKVRTAAGEGNGFTQ